MINLKEFAKILYDFSLTNFIGVPDSTFKDWISYLDIDERFTNTVAVNECEAIAIAAGNYLASNKASVVYLQNSGLGKIINPLTSLNSKDVFSIPALLMIGWRGEPEGPSDAPQHKMMGKKTLELLKVLEVPYSIIEANAADVVREIKKAVIFMEQEKSPYAIILRKGLFEKLEKNNSKTYDDRQNSLLKREDILKIVLEIIGDEFPVVSTTGKTSRELYELRKQMGLIYNKMSIRN